MSVVVKMKYNDGKQRRRRVDINNISLAYLKNLAKENILLTKQAPSLVYEDDEGDLVTIASDNCVSEALRQLKPSQSLKLQVVSSPIAYTPKINETISSDCLKCKEGRRDLKPIFPKIESNSAPPHGDKSTQTKNNVKSRNKNKNKKPTKTKPTKTKPTEKPRSFHYALPKHANFGRGSRGDAVQQLQHVLIALGYMHPSAISWCSGIYGPRTTEAISRVARKMGSINRTELSGLYTEGIRQFLIHELSNRKDDLNSFPHGKCSRQAQSIPPIGCSLQRLITVSFILMLLPPQLLYFAFYFALAKTVFMIPRAPMSCLRMGLSSYVLPILAALFLQRKCSCACCMIFAWFALISGVHICKNIVSSFRRCRRKHREKRRKRMKKRCQEDRHQIELAFKSLKPLRLAFPGRSDAELFYQLRRCRGSVNEAAWMLSQH